MIKDVLQVLPKQGSLLKLATCWNVEGPTQMTISVLLCTSYSIYAVYNAYSKLVFHKFYNWQKQEQSNDTIYVLLEWLNEKQCTNSVVAVL